MNYSHIYEGLIKISKIIILKPADSSSGLLSVEASPSKEGARQKLTLDRTSFHLRATHTHTHTHTVTPTWTLWTHQFSCTVLRCGRKPSPWESHTGMERTCKPHTDVARTWNWFFSLVDVIMKSTKWYYLRIGCIFYFPHKLALLFTQQRGAIDPK